MQPTTRTPEEALLQPYLAPAPVLAIISGPSGVGKDSVIQGLRSQQMAFHFVVTCTTRPIREGEREGIDYYFMDEAEFERKIAADEMLEHTRVYGAYKGSERSRIRTALASGLDVIMRVDVQGTATIKAKVPGCITIFIAPPSLEVLRQRLEQRGADSPSQLQRRLETAWHEIACSADFDYIVTNHEGRLPETVDAVKAIIRGARYRTGRQPIEL